MEEMTCPKCNTQIKTLNFAEWVEQWEDFQWNSPEWRDLLIKELWELCDLKDKLNNIEPLYEEQVKYIKTLERQLELLQKTLDIAEKFAPRPLVISGLGEVIK